MFQKALIDAINKHDVIKNLHNRAPQSVERFAEEMYNAGKADQAGVKESIDQVDGPLPDGPTMSITPWGYCISYCIT